MKLSVMADSLTPALTIALRSVNKRSTLPVLENVRIEGSDGYLTLDTTNLTVWTHVRVPGKIEEDEPAATTVKCADLLGIAKLASRETNRRLDLIADGKRLSIVTGDAIRGLPTLEAEEFPSFRSPKDRASFTFQSGELLRALAQTSFAAARDEAQPILMGVSMKYAGKAPEFAAADNYRVAVSEAPHLASKGEHSDVVLRNEFVDELLRVLPDTDDEVTLIVDRPGNMAAVTVTVRGGKRATGPAYELEVTIVGSLIDGVFPNYVQVIPRNLTSAVTVNRLKLLNALTGAKAVAENAANIIRFDGNEHGLKVSAKDGEDRTFESTVAGDLAGDAFTWSGDARYLLSLHQIDDGLVRFSTSGPMVPGIFDVPERTDWKYVVMSVRTAS